MFDFLEKDTMEVWVNGVVVETAVSIHYLKPCCVMQLTTRSTSMYNFVQLHVAPTQARLTKDLDILQLSA